jgi:hypothetical protein
VTARAALLGILLARQREARRLRDHHLAAVRRARRRRDLRAEVEAARHVEWFDAQWWSFGKAVEDARRLLRRPARRRAA